MGIRKVVGDCAFAEKYSAYLRDYQPGRNAKGCRYDWQPFALYRFEA
ncbi:MAG: hypothetical protein PSY14_12745 [bacterium]|nr:hypothetical protein [bacterium]